MSSEPTWPEATYPSSLTNWQNTLDQKEEKKMGRNGQLDRQVLVRGQKYEKQKSDKLEIFQLYDIN